MSVTTHIIVSRHPAAMQLIIEEARAGRIPVGFAQAPVIAQASADDVAGRCVAGNLPLHLAALADEVWAVEFEGQPPRGTEYGVEEMRAAGATIRLYAVYAGDRVRAVRSAIDAWAG